MGTGSAPPIVPPEGWYWSHDILPHQVGPSDVPGHRLMRLSSYRHGDLRRFASVVHRAPGAEHRCLLDLDAAESASCERAVSVTVDDGAGQPRFSVVVSTDPGYRSSIHVDLDEAAVQAMAGVTDVAPYVVDGGRRYAVVVDPLAGSSRVLAALTERRLRARLRRLRATPTRLRAHLGAGLLTAVVVPRAGGKSFWYAGLDADRVARKLSRHRAYPLDLDATRSADGVRYTVVMRRDPTDTWLG